MRTPHTVSPARRIAGAGALLLTLQAFVASASADPFPHAEATVEELQQEMHDGTLDSRSLTQSYLDRIAALDSAGPRLRSVVELNPNALAEAVERDRERAAGQVRGPMHGIPVLLKDNIQAVPMGTSAGSLAIRMESRDSAITRLLRERGAVIIGKSNMSEWAGFRGMPSISGWSARGGQTLNPYRTTHDPCGSSSGSAVAVSANLAAVAVGTETDGSIICPASMNGVVGFKPSFNHVSMHGVVPISALQDMAGPITRTVADADAAIVLNAMTSMLPPVTLDPQALDGARIGVIRAGLETQPEIAGLLDDAVSVLEAAGATVVEVSIPSGNGSWREAELTALLFEFKEDMESFLSAWPQPGIRTVQDLIDFNERHADAELALFGQELFEAAASKGGTSDPEYGAARGTAWRLARREGLDPLLDGMSLNAVIAPAANIAAPLGSPDYSLASPSSAAAVAGYPSLTVPMGLVDGLPAGLLFIGKRGDDGHVLSLGYSYEQRSLKRSPPTL